MCVRVFLMIFFVLFLVYSEYNIVISFRNQILNFERNEKIHILFPLILKDYKY